LTVLLDARLRNLSLLSRRLRLGLLRLSLGLLNRPARPLRNHRLYRLHSAERSEPLVGICVEVADSRAFRRKAGLRPKTFFD
jgi:hypothetical protein